MGICIGFTEVSLFDVIFYCFTGKESIQLVAHNDLRNQSGRIQNPLDPDLVFSEGSGLCIYKGQAKVFLKGRIRTYGPLYGLHHGQPLRDDFLLLHRNKFMWYY